jgi:hypothetical protein
MMIATILLIAGVLVPATIQKAKTSKRVRCVGNLRRIELAFRIWPTDASDAFPMSRPTNGGGTLEFVGVPGSTFRHFGVVSNELADPKALLCPADSRRKASSFSNLTETNISYFVGVDALKKYPNGWLAGDRNLLTNAFQFTNGLMALQINRKTGWDHRIHGGSGNVCLSNGSVRQSESSVLQALLTIALISGEGPQRLSIP